MSAPVPRWRSPPSFQGQLDSFQLPVTIKNYFVEHNSMKTHLKTSPVSLWFPSALPLLWSPARRILLKSRDFLPSEHCWRWRWCDAHPRLGEDTLPETDRCPTVALVWVPLVLQVLVNCQLSSGRVRNYFTFDNRSYHICDKALESKGRRGMLFAARKFEETNVYFISSQKTVK